MQKILSTFVMSVAALFVSFNSTAANPNTTKSPSRQIREEIDRLFRSYQGSVPGASVLVLKSGRVFYQKSFGMADLENGRAADEFTNYRLASLSKAFTAMAILLLAQDYALTLDTKLTEVISFPGYGGDITIRHLLNHTSGLRDYEDHIPPTQETQLTDHDVVTILKGLRSGYFPPGTQYRYSNSGYATLAVIVETVSGMSFADLLKSRIFNQLGMFDSVAYENGISTVAQRAFGYSPANGSRFRRTDQSITSAVLGDGGVYTSVRDLIRWDEAWYRNSILSDEWLQAALEPGRLENGQEIGYGFGWMLSTYRGTRKVSHTGSTIGFRTAIQRYPDKQLTIIVLANRANASPWERCTEIADIVWNEL